MSSTKEIAHAFITRDELNKVRNNTKCRIEAYGTELWIDKRPFAIYLNREIGSEYVDFLFDGSTYFFGSTQRDVQSKLLKIDNVDSHPNKVYKSIQIPFSILGAILCEDLDKVMKSDGGLRSTSLNGFNIPWGRLSEINIIEVLHDTFNDGEMEIEIPSTINDSDKDHVISSLNVDKRTYASSHEIEQFFRYLFRCQEPNKDIPDDINPFNSITTIGNISCYRLSDRKIGFKFKEHHLGSVLFEFNHRYFLSALEDKSKLNGHTSGYFCVELNRKCKTIDEAYSSMVPPQISGKEGIDYLRQGEYFFVRTGFKTISDMRGAGLYLKVNEKSLIPTNGVPSNIDNIFRHDPPNYDEYDGIMFVKEVKTENGTRPFVPVLYPLRVDGVEGVKEEYHLFNHKNQINGMEMDFVCLGKPRFNGDRLADYNFQWTWHPINKLKHPDRHGNNHISPMIVMERRQKNPRMWVKERVKHNQHKTIEFKDDFFYEVFENIVKNSWSIGTVD